MKPNNYLVFTWKTMLECQGFKRERLVLFPFPLRCFEWFIPCWAMVLQTECHFERHPVQLLLSNPNGSTVNINESKLHVCLTKFIKDVICRATWIAVTLATVGSKQDCYVLQCFFSCPIYRLYFDILYLNVSCLYMLPVGSIKTKTNKKNLYIHLPLTTRSCTLHWNRVIHVALVPTLEDIICWFAKSFLKLNEHKLSSSLALKTPVVL